MIKRPTLSIVVCAAGVGSRAGFAKNKLLVPFEGECALVRTIAKLQLPEVDEIILSIRPSDEEEIKKLCAPYDKIRLVHGGETRTHSVYNALQVATGEVVLIHDGARPFFTRQMLQGCYQSVLEHGSGICAIPSTDTIALGDEFIEDVPDRGHCYLIQTPQGFFTHQIKAAYQQAFDCGDIAFTDDSSLYAKYVGKPRLCAG